MMQGKRGEKDEHMNEQKYVLEGEGERVGVGH